MVKIVIQATPPQIGYIKPFRLTDKVEPIGAHEKKFIEIVNKLKNIRDWLNANKKHT